MRVAVTGIGLVSPLGTTPAGMFEALLGARSGIVSYPEHPDLGLSHVAVAPCQPTIGIAGIEEKYLIDMDRGSRLALAAGIDAMQQAGYAHASMHASTALLWSTGMGGIETLEAGYANLFRQQKKRLRPMTVPMAMPSAPTFHLAQHFGLSGETTTISAACASSAIAIAYGWRLIAAGAYERVLVGGSESMLTPAALRAWQMTGALAAIDVHRPSTSCKPFATARSGFVIGEGAAGLVLENAYSVQQRGAAAIGYIEGFGLNTDAQNISRPSLRGQEQAMQMALHHAQIRPNEIAYLNAHATGTQVGDAIEVESIRNVFGSHAEKMAISSTKAQHGHLIGAAGALEAIICLLALRRGQLPATIHANEIDPAFKDIRLITAPAETPHARYAMSNSFAFGGINASVILSAQ